MLEIRYPEPDFRVKKEAGQEFIFDRFRKKWVLLTPEEWVRQNFALYLIQSLKYPAALLALEKEIRLGELSKRFDIVVFDRNHQPWLMVECKAPDVRLNESVLHQVLRYSVSVPVTYLVITNGNQALGWQKKDGRLDPVTELPAMM